jgi:hypothetical protein
MQTARREELAVDGKAPPDILALKPDWGKPTVRNFRGSGGNVGIIRSPVRATALPGGDLGGPWWTYTRTKPETADRSRNVVPNQSTIPLGLALFESSLQTPQQRSG